MLYIRKLFTQDLRDGKQIAFPKEVSYSFFCFDYINKEEDRKIKFTFRANFGQFQEFEGKEITTRLYAAGSESRMDGEVKAFIRDELKAQVDDLLIIKSKGTKHIDFDVMFVPKSNSQYYPLLLKLSFSENHSVYSAEEQIQEECTDKFPLQQIFYGAPGTGKSHAIDNVVTEDNSIRTTFHPDSDYASFVGSYKPTMEAVTVSSIVIDNVLITKPQGEFPNTEKKIVYKFIPQAFLKAYIKAWSVYDPAKDNPFYLVIEEINRGNCAQIFGDLFQLLDRNNMGASSYSINADDDIRHFIDEEDGGFKGLSEEQKKIISEFVLVKDTGKEENIGEAILNGTKLLLPPNMRIWATMNTSDQSLFPIDSAFKRRWDWKYIPIEYDKENWVFEVGGKHYNWGEFLSKINPEIYTITESPDKQMGYYFAKANPTTGIISQDTFVNKVLFYLWTDVFKDYDVASVVFKNKKTNRAFRFTDFFEDTEALGNFIENMGLVSP